MQYNPDTLSRSLQPQAVTDDAHDRSQALRLKGPPVETIKLDAEIDATDQLEFPDQNPNAVELGIAPQLAALETLSIRRAVSSSPTTRFRRAGRSRSFRSKRRSRCSSGANSASCRCESPIAA
jgi:hypothetical protein